MDRGGDIHRDQGQEGEGEKESLLHTLFKNAVVPNTLNDNLKFLI